MILEDQNVLEAAIFLKVEDAVAEGPQNVFDALGGQGGKAGRMVRRLDDDLVRADAVHAVEHALGLTVQGAFDAQGWELVGDDADRPSGRVALRGRAAICVGAVGLNFRRSLALVAVAKRAESALDFQVFADEVSGAFGAVCGNDHPAANNRIFSKLLHSRTLSTGRANLRFYPPKDTFWNT